MANSRSSTQQTRQQSRQPLRHIAPYWQVCLHMLAGPQTSQAVKHLRLARRTSSATSYAWLSSSCACNCMLGPISNYDQHLTGKPRLGVVPTHVMQHHDCVSADFRCCAGRCNGLSALTCRPVTTYRWQPVMLLEQVLLEASCPWQDCTTQMQDARFITAASPAGQACHAERHL